MRIKDHVQRTAVRVSPALNESAGVEFFFKCENEQLTGSFKIRGAVNALMQLTKAERARGVVTHSSGNHGAALAEAATSLGLAAWIIMPNNTSAAKRRNVQKSRGTIIDCGPSLAERESTLEVVARDTGSVFIPPYDHPWIVAGQGTAALELLDEVERLDELWVPVGGGGLAGGTGLVCAERGVRVFGGEPALADDAFQSLKTGQRQPQRPPLTIADGLRTALGELNFQLLSACGLQIQRVSEDQIITAQRRLQTTFDRPVEPSGAVAYAACLAARTGGTGADVDSSLLVGKRIGVIVSGGNVA